MNAISGRLRALIVLLGALVVATSACQVPDPVESQLTPADWGDGVRPHYRDVAYSDASSAQKLDVYLNSRGGQKGVIVYIHGGGFVTGDKYPLTGIGNIKRQLHRGFDIVSINYRLSSEETGSQATYFNMVADVAAALRFVKSEGARYKIDTSHVIVAGHSAGGSLAALAGTAANSPQPEFRNMPRVDGWIAGAGILDWRCGSWSAGWIGLLLGPDYAAYRDRASAVNHMDVRDPAGYVVQGKDDWFVESCNAATLDKKLRTRGGDDLVALVNNDIVDVSSTGKRLPGREHVPWAGANARWMDDWLDERAA